MDNRDLRDGVRETWIMAGALLQLLVAVGAVYWCWTRGVTLASFAITLAACAVCQAGAMAVVLWPGPGRADLTGLLEVHQVVTVALLCISWIFGVIPAIPILDHVLAAPDRPEMAIFFAGLAYMLASIAGLIGVNLLAERLLSAYAK